MLGGCLQCLPAERDAKWPSLAGPSRACHGGTRGTAWWRTLTGIQCRQVARGPVPRAGLRSALFGRGASAVLKGRYRRPRRAEAAAAGTLACGLRSGLGPGGGGAAWPARLAAWGRANCKSTRHPSRASRASGASPRAAVRAIVGAIRGVDKACLEYRAGQRDGSGPRQAGGLLNQYARLREAQRRPADCSPPAPPGPIFA